MRNLLFVLALSTSTQAFAADALIPVHGNLRTEAGEPIDGNRQIKFTFYADSGGAQQVWTAQESVTLNGGNFTVYLGRTSPITTDLFADHDGVWLGIEIDGERMPLIQMGTAPFAAFATRAGDADTLEGESLDDILEVATYTAGNGLNLVDNTFSVDEADLAALLNDNYLDAAYRPSWTSITGIPAGFSDGTDNDTTYSAGTGVNLTGTTFSANQGTIEGWARGVCYDTESELTSLLNDNYLDAAYRPGWSSITGIPSGFSDGTDNDTTYSAGTGITLSGTTFSANQATIEGWARGVSYDTESELTSLLNDNYLGASGNQTLTSGNLTLTSGNATLTKGNLTLTDGAVTLTKGDLTLSAGKISASGSVRLGNDTATCTSSLGGTMRFTTTNGLEMCGALDSTTHAWVPVNGMPTYTSVRPTGLATAGTTTLAPVLLEESPNASSFFRRNTSDIEILRTGVYEITFDVYGFGSNRVYTHREDSVDIWFMTQDGTGQANTRFIREIDAGAKLSVRGSCSGTCSVWDSKLGNQWTIRYLGPAY